MPEVHEEVVNVALSDLLEERGLLSVPETIRKAVRGEPYWSKLEGKNRTRGNSGIGLATAKQFVNERAYVFITGP